MNAPEHDLHCPEQRLNTWKEIGAFFGRDERTVKRWEKERGLPVRRIPGTGRSSVYAHRAELVAWLQNSGGATEPETAAELPCDPITTEVAPEPPQAAAAPSRPFWTIRVRLAALLTSLFLLGTLSGIIWFRHAAGQRTAASRVRRVNPEAEDLYLKGIYFWHKRSPKSLTQAVDYFTQSIVQDPQYAPAYVGLADCYNLLREYTTMPPEIAYPRAISAARRALAIDDSLSGAHRSLGFAEFYWSWDAPHAEIEFKRAIALDPRSSIGHYWYATFLAELCRFDESLAEIDLARKLDPQTASILADKGLILYLAGRNAEAISLLKQMETAEPELLSPHRYLCAMYLVTENFPEYLKEGRSTASMLHDNDQLAVIGAAESGWEQCGRHCLLERILVERKRLQENGHEQAYVVAQTYAQLGRRREAIAYLKLALAAHEPVMIALRADPCLKTLHAAPEFRELVKAVGLPPIL